MQWRMEKKEATELSGSEFNKIDPHCQVHVT